MKPPDKAKFKFYEYPLYWLVTVILVILAIPIFIGKAIVFLVRSAGSPLKSAGHFFGFIMVILIVAALFIGYKIYVPYRIGSETVSITVSKSDNFAHVMEQLKDNNILHDARLFKMMAVITGLDKSISPGRYDFSEIVSLNSILKKFRHRDISTLMLTIPEGLTVREIASIVADNLDIDSAEFVDRAFDTSYTRDKYGLEGLEGYLFPETYRFWYEIEIDDIINIMVDEFRNQTAGLFDSLPEDGLSEAEIVTLASIIQAEARDGSEQGLISSVYHNRLLKRMLLQADPTVIYALGGLDRPLWYRDLKYDSPYNTYMYLGLPPGPINSPGLAAIVAAFKPDSSGFLYFVADGTGKHIFSETLLEHNRAKNRIKKSKRSNGG